MKRVAASLVTHILFLLNETNVMEDRGLWVVVMGVMLGYLGILGMDAGARVKKVQPSRNM